MSFTKSSKITLNTVNIGTARNIPSTPKYAPPNVTASKTTIWLIFKELPTIFGFIIFASICCNIITTTAIKIVWPSPPVNSVMMIAITTAIIAPKYGIKLNSPIIKPKSTEYFTPIIDIAIETSTPTNKLSNI